MNGPVRFALIGKSGSGKSCAGEMLCQHFAIKHIKTGAICRQIARLLFDNEDKRSTQLLDDALTAIEPSIFLRAALRSTSPDQGFVLDALRFSEDVEQARKLGCRIVRIVAPEAIRVARLAARGQAFELATDGMHRSETELDTAQVDFEVVNDTDLGALHLALSRIAVQI